MKRTLRQAVGILTVSLAFFALPSVSEAKGKRTPPPKIPYTAIVSVDQTAMTITVEPKNSPATGTKTYKFTAKTKVTSNGHDGTLADLVPGQQIHVGIGMNEGVAEELKVTAPPPDPVVPGKPAK